MHGHDCNTTAHIKSRSIFVYLYKVPRKMFFFFALFNFKRNSQKGNFLGEI